MTSVEGAVIAVRPPSVADRAGARGIVAKTGIFRADELEIALEVFDGAVRAPGDDYYALGAYEGDRLVGFACYGPTPCTVATWDLYWIAVDPAAQRQGVGRRLMEACETAIRGHRGRIVVVETASRADYAPARTFYETLGYGRAAHIADFYAPHDDLVVYVKRLEASRMEESHHG